MEKNSSENFCRKVLKKLEKNSKKDLLFEKEYDIITAVAVSLPLCGSVRKTAFAELGGIKMAKCCLCGKGVVFGQNVSHSHVRTNRSWKPNIRKVKVDGGKAIHVCARCLRTLKKA